MDPTPNKVKYSFRKLSDTLYQEHDSIDDDRHILKLISTGLGSRMTDNVISTILCIIDHIF